MPYRYYHGRTGRVFHVVNRAVGVLVNKRVRHRIMVKRIYVRVEHIQPSKCRENFTKRVQANAQMAAEAKKKNIKVNLKRKPRDPRPAVMVEMGDSEVKSLAIRPAV